MGARKKRVLAESGIATAVEFPIAAEELMSARGRVGRMEDLILVFRRSCRSIRRVRETFRRLCN